MATGQLLQIKQRDRESGTTFIYRASADLASQLPELRLPRMHEAARFAFRSVQDYEKPSGNGSLVDVLALAEARGFCAHPSDWIPAFDNDAQHPRLYQPWVDWLSDNELTPFHEGNSLTAENWDRWKPRPRLLAFSKLLRENQRAAHDLLIAICPTQPAAMRQALLNEIGAGGAFYGIYPKQVPMVEYFLADRSAKIVAVAQEKLKRMDGLDTEEAHAAEIAKHIKVGNGSVTYKVPPAPHTSPFFVNYCCTNFEALADALGLSPEELARQSDLEQLGSSFSVLVVSTGDVGVRTIVAERLLEKFPPENIPIRLFQGLPRPLQERAVRAQFKSNYWNSVHEALGGETGTLNASQMREMAVYEYLEPSVIDELASKKLPVNKSYDPLRVLGLVVNKAAAKEVWDKALTLGMKPDNPRLSMLEFNMAL